MGDVVLAQLAPGLPVPDSIAIVGAGIGGLSLAVCLLRHGQWGMFQSPESASWISTNGRVVLLDDAAHAMAPFTGQGAGSAIQDGLCLGTLLADSGPAVSALRKYEQVRKPVCETAIQRAYSRGMHITAHGLTAGSSIP